MLKLTVATNSDSDMVGCNDPAVLLNCYFHMGCYSSASTEGQFQLVWHKGSAMPWRLGSSSNMSSVELLDCTYLLTLDKIPRVFT